jgi:hypothetical protein
LIAVRTLVAVVGYRNLSDLSIGPNLLPDLLANDWEPGVQVEDLSYGPIAVVQNLEDRPPYDRMVFLSAVQRGRVPGDFYRYEWRAPLPPEEEIQARIGEAVTGVISLENLLVIAQYFHVLATEVIIVELEPIDCESGEQCSEIVTGLMPSILRTVRAEAHGRAYSRTAE